MAVSSLLWRAAGAVLCVLVAAGEAAADICVDVDLKVAGHDLSPLAEQSLRSEAAALWQPYGVRIQWSTTGEESRCSPVHASFDVRVEYQPTPAGKAPRTIVLGSTQLVSGTIDCAAIVLDYDATEELIGSSPAIGLFTLAGQTQAGPADIGRALGRVLAHEIGHVLLAESRHPLRGLMRKSFAARDLVTYQRRAYTLSREEVDRLRQREHELTGPGRGQEEGQTRVRPLGV
ncbi:MAG TPA: hypothetical protein VFV98_14265 [Vicinamibacterales bacterium]|nr:hypothetical protein [Vicinamibacterales bacterium]